MTLRGQVLVVVFYYQNLLRINRCASISKMRTTSVSNTVIIQCHAFKIFEKKNSDGMSHYRYLQDDIFDWGDVKFPVGNNERSRFEQNERLVAINVFEPDVFFNDKGTMPIKSVRSTKVRDDAKKQY